MRLLCMHKTEIDSSGPVKSGLRTEPGPMLGNGGGGVARQRVRVTVTTTTSVTRDPGQG